MNNKKLRQLDRAEVIAWLVFFGLGVNYLLLTFLFAH